MEVDENELFDKILQEIGGFGKYQKFLLFLRLCSFTKSYDVKKCATEILQGKFMTYFYFRPFGYDHWHQNSVFCFSILLLHRIKKPMIITKRPKIKIFYEFTLQNLCRTFSHCNFL